MKIAFVYDAVYPWIKGGAEKRVYEIAKRLVERGHEVHWYGIGWWWPEKSQKDIEMDGIQLHGVCKPVDLYVDGRRSTKEAIDFAIHLFPVLIKEKYDIVDCQSFPYFSCFTSKLYAMIKGSTLFITWIEVWNDYWYEYLGKKGFFGKITEKMATKLTKNLIAISTKTRNDLGDIGVKQEILIAPVGIDMDAIHRIKPAKRSSDVIFVGRLIKNKNVDILIEAIHLVKEKIPQVKCVIIGDGPERNHLERLVSNLKIQNNVFFKGFVENHNEIISHMKSSKVFVLPSTREGFGIVVVEANACGLPAVVINHRMNAAVDIIDDNVNGFISDYSPEDLATKIISGITQKEYMSIDSIENARKYNWKKIVEDIENFYLRKG